MKYNFYVSNVSVEAVFNRLGGTEGAKEFLRSELVLVDRDAAICRGNLLTFEGKVRTESRRFVVGESFVMGNPKVRFGYIDERIVRLFGKSQDVPAGEIAVHTLLVPSHDPEIMVALGPQSRRFIQLGQFYQLIEAQGHGQEGPLLVNGCAYANNIPYVIDDNGAPWALRAFWSLAKHWWHVNASPVSDPSAWYAGCQVFSQVSGG